MFDVALFSNFSKPENSTKQPSGGESFPCQMVEPCGVINPNISFNQGVDWNPSEYNYAQIPVFGRYYWITEWTFNRGRWYATMKVDSLASWKDSILGLEEYVLRSSVDYDTNVIDSMYPMKANVTSQLTISEVWPTGEKTSGTVIIGVVGSNGTSFGSVGYFQTGYAQLANLGEKMFTDTSWVDGAEAAKDIGDALLKCLVNPSQYLQSVTWFPVKPAQTSAIDTIKMGWWSTGLGAGTYEGLQPLLGKLTDARPSHPKSARGAYLNYAPYTEMYVDFPPFGRIALDTDKFPAGEQINYQIIIDGISGMGMLRLYATSNKPEIRFAKIGVSIALAESTPDYIGGLNSAMGAVGNALSGNFAGALSGVGNAIANASPNVNISGTNGGMVFYSQPARLVTIFHDITDDDPLHYGKPLCKKRVLSTLSGYTVVGHGDVNIPCTETEKTSIKAFMEGGFFIE